MDEKRRTKVNYKARANTEAGRERLADAWCEFNVWEWPKSFSLPKGISSRKNKHLRDHRMRDIHMENIVKALADPYLTPAWDRITRRRRAEKKAR